MYFGDEDRIEIVCSKCEQYVIGLKLAPKPAEGKQEEEG
jgi:hypothetical protein